MDKKNTLIGVSLLVAAFALMFLVGPKPTPPSKAQPVQEMTKTGGPNQAQPEAVTSPRDAAFASVFKEIREARTYSLSNEFVEVRFTNFGGAIKEVALKKYDADKKRKGDPYLINRMHADPALAIVNLPGLDRNSGFELVSQDLHTIVFRAVFENRIEVIRRYTLTEGSGDKTKDPYQLRYETTFRNLGDQTVPFPRVELSVGTAAPLNADDYGLYLSNAYKTEDDTEFIKRSKLQGGGFLSWIGVGSKDPLPFIESTASIQWASVQNQFFVSILTPDSPGSSLVTRRVELPAFPGTSTPAMGMTGVARFDMPALSPKGEVTLSGSYYAGPKEYTRLSNSEIFKLDQDAVMDFGFFSFFSKILLTLMTWVHGLMPNATWGWGFAIVITTLVLKFVFFPLNMSASKSAKRMQKIQPELTAMREKYKDNPQKIQTETMELFKKHRVNPMGGCLPILITIPFFIGFFSMLQSAAELRFQEFLWASDLSAPDTIATVFGFPVNIMPVLMGATMIIQMHITPQPTVDNMQAKMFKFMPYIFAIFCYNFSCALSLYSTVNGIFTIGQQLVVNRMKDVPVTVAAPAKKGRQVKNVTPKN